MPIFEKNSESERSERLRCVPHRNLLAGYNMLCCFDKQSTFMKFKFYLRKLNYKENMKSLNIDTLTYNFLLNYDDETCLKLLNCVNITNNNIYSNVLLCKYFSEKFNTRIIILKKIAELLQQIIKIYQNNTECCDDIQYFEKKSESALSDQLRGVPHRNLFTGYNTACVVLCCLFK